MLTAQDWIESLQLTPHPEGGFFREMYRCPETIAQAHLPPRFSGARSFVTAIYFLLRSQDFSALHRLRQDEIWHFYDGTALTLTLIDPPGNLRTIRLGREVRAGEVLQAVVPGGCLFGAAVDAPDSYALVGCTVAPGFDFADFEMPPRQSLLTAYPQHQAVIERLTR